MFKPSGSTKWCGLVFDSGARWDASLLSSPHHEGSFFVGGSVTSVYHVPSKITFMALPHANGTEKCNHPVCLEGRAILVYITSLYLPLSASRITTGFFFPPYPCDYQCTCLIHMVTFTCPGRRIVSPSVSNSVPPLARGLCKTPCVKPLLFVCVSCFLDH